MNIKIKEKSRLHERVGESQLNNYGSKMFIVEYRTSQDIDVYFPDYDYTVKGASYSAFKNGNIKCPFDKSLYGIGYIGVGEYNTSHVDENGDTKQLKSYLTWSNMLYRCYNPKAKEKLPTYSDCKVVDEWHNFQNFASWFDDNYYEIEGQQMALDKDILYKGNKIYSPETCIFVPKCINTLFIKRDACRGELPIGVDFNKGKYRAKCNVCSGEQKFLGYFDNVDEAFNTYKNFKEKFIKDTAERYRHVISNKLYEHMLMYSVDRDD